MRTTLRIPALAAAVLLLGACRKSTLVIESNTSWAGTIKEGDNASYAVSGTGDRTFTMPTDDFCWTIQKQTEAGRLYTVAKVPDFISTDKGGERETYAPFGAAVGCSGQF